MDYSKALSFSFEDEQWVKKLGIGGAISFFSLFFGSLLITGFFIVGYYIGILRKVMNKEENCLPDWSNFGKLFVDGLLGGIICLIYLLLIGGLGAALIVAIATDESMGDAEMVILIVLTSLLIVFFLAVFSNLGMMQFAATDDFSAAFNLSGIFRLLRQNWSTYFAIITFSIILNLILFLAGLVIFSAFTNFWGLVVQAHLFGQTARELRAPAMAMQSA